MSISSPVTLRFKGHCSKGVINACTFQSHTRYGGWAGRWAGCSEIWLAGRLVDLTKSRVHLTSPTVNNELGVKDPLSAHFLSIP